MRIYRFDRCVVRPAWRTLEIDGRPAVLGARAFDVLLALIEHRDRVLSKAELMDLAWPGRVVEENNLEVQICALRKAIGAPAIATVARRGYRFAALVADGSGDAAGLPAPRGALFGREHELAALRELLASHRLVTIVGAGGIGKTALALAAVRGEQASSAPAVAWVDLAPVRDPAQLADAVARALGLPLDREADGVDALLAALAPMRRLLVLDNAEHLAGHVARWAEAVLARATGVRLLVTSQARLGLAAERVLRLDTLAVPDAGATPAQAIGHAAVALFVDAARAEGEAFVVDASNVVDVVDVCRRLDGLPLAIELAAARLPLLGLARLRQGLDRRLALLASSRRDPPDRQATLRASLEWTCGMLDASAQRAFRRLGVCVGGFPFELALALAGGDGIDDEAAAAHLAVLIEPSLVVPDGSAQPRYRMLESARLYALELLQQAGETDAARACLTTAMAARCDAIATDFVAESDRVFLARHAPELDNLRTALACAQASDGGAAITLAGAFARIGALLSLTGESLAHLDRAEAHVTSRTAPLTLARLQVARSLFARSQPLDRVLDGLRAAIVALRVAGRPVECLHAAAQFASRCRRREVTEAGAWLDEVRILCADDPRPAVQLHLAQAEYGVAVDRDGLDDQRHRLAQSLALATAAGHEHAVHLAQWNLGWLAALHGEPAAGAAMARAILARAEAGAPNLTWLANGLALLLTSLLGLGRVDEARDVALRLVVLGVPLRRMHEFSDSFALLCAMNGDCSAAARLIGFADAESERLASRRDRAGCRNRDLAFERARPALGDARVRELMRQGAALQAVQVETLVASGISMECGASTAEARAGRRMRAQ